MLAPERGRWTMSTTGQAPLQAFARGRAPRRPLAVPVRVTVLRPDTAHSVTGRALNLGEGGIAISLALADEVRVSDPVAIEFPLPARLGVTGEGRGAISRRLPLRASVSRFDPVSTSRDS